MKAFRYAILAWMLLFAVNLSQAATVVDTGPGPTDTTVPYYSLYAGQYPQFLSGQFSLSQAYTITEIDGWMYPRNSSTTFTIAIYGDGGLIPNSTQYFSQQASVGTGICPPAGPCPPIDWYGLSGLNLSLNQGTYWAAFEVRPGDTFYGTMPSNATVSLPAQPLTHYAYYNTGEWYAEDSLRIGIRIFGAEASNVPEPTTMLLLGFGLLGVASVRRSRKSGCSK
jgi:hypothetical protein